MPGLVAHALFPLLPLLAFTRFRRRLAVALAPVTLLPDADYFFGIHRATTTNAWVVLLPLALWWLAGRGGRLARWREHLALVTIFLGSHLLMDLFVGGIVPFWPFVDKTWVVDLTVDVDTSANRPLVYLDWGLVPGPPVVSRVYAFLTRTDAAVLALLAAFGLGAALARWRAGKVQDATAPQGSPEQGRGP